MRSGDLRETTRGRNKNEAKLMGGERVLVD